MQIYVNIETVPPLGSSPNPDSVRPPKSYKKPDAVRKYQLEKAQEVHQNLAKDPAQCQVVIVSYAVDDGEVTCLVDIDERSLLTRFQEEILSRPTTRLRWVSYNGARFDYPALFWRAVKYRLDTLREEFKPYRGRWQSDRLDDVFVSLGSSGSLDSWARFFGVPNDNPIPGSQIGECIRTGRHDLVERHARSRITVLRDINKLLKGD